MSGDMKAKLVAEMDGYLKRQVEEMRDAAQSWTTEEGTEGAGREELAAAVSYLAEGFLTIDGLTDWPFEKDSEATSKKLEALLEEQAKWKKQVHDAQLVLSAANARYEVVKREVRQAEAAHSAACEREGK